MPHAPNLTVFAGPNGSGKTTLTRPMLQSLRERGIDYMNPDDVAKEKFGGWEAPGAFLKTVTYVEDWRNECLRNRRSFAFETVLSTIEKVQFIDKARQAGFFVRLFYVGTIDPAINVARVAQRVREKGHNVPTDKIISRYYKSINNCLAACQTASTALVYDNSVDNARHRLIFETRNGQVEAVHTDIDDMPKWAGDVLEALLETR